MPVRSSPTRTGTPAAIMSRFDSSFEPMAAIVARRRSDEDEPGVDHRLGEHGVLGEEPVTGVDGVGTRSPWPRR